MKSCAACDKRMDYTQILKSFSWYYKPVTCMRCGKHYVLTNVSRCLLSIMIVLPMVFLIQVEWEFLIEILIHLIGALIVIFTAPFFVSFKEKE